MSELRDLCDRLSTSRAARAELTRRFVAWRASSAAAAEDLLDELAGRAPLEPAALDVLLELVDRHGLARPAIRTLLITDADVDDVQQAVLAVIALRIRQFEGRSRFSTWLHRVAVNEAKMLIRSRQRRPAVPVAEPRPAPFLARLSTLTADRDLLDRAIADLPEKLRAPLELRELHQLDYGEIALELDLPVGTVRSRLNRARSFLTARLRDELGDAWVPGES